jgi:mannose-6-phosphate isomerase-like protein (cupin superfamily)
MHRKMGCILDCSVMNTHSFDFRGTRMTVSLSTADAAGVYSVIEMIHPPNVGPALHIHPRGPESFFIIEGTYTFVRGSEIITLVAGQAISIPAGTPHRYTVGPAGGRAIVICPPELECYFQSVAELLKRGAVPIAEEFAIASRYGQDFLDSSSHWGIK